MSLPQQQVVATTAKDQIDAVLAEATRIILGKEHVIRLALTCLIARGHLLIEDQPGVGKTTLATCWRRALGLTISAHPVHQRPAAGGHTRVSVYNRDTGGFEFHPGPVFTRSCWPMRSTVRHHARRARCLRPWKKTRSPSRAKPGPANTVFRHRHSESDPTRSALSRCPSRNWIDS
jgi:hypothetical protein